MILAPFLLALNLVFINVATTSQSEAGNLKLALDITVDILGFLDNPVHGTIHLLYKLAEQLDESSADQAQIIEDVNAIGHEVNNVYNFLRSSKKGHSHYRVEEVNETSEAFRQKAQEFTRPSGPFAGMMNWGTANHLKLLIAKSEPELQKLVDKYANNTTQVTAKTIDCDVAKYQTNQTGEIVGVLGTEVRYLITKPQEVVEKAVSDGRDELKSKVGSTASLTSDKIELIKGLYEIYKKDNKITSSSTTKESVPENVYHRLVETCTELAQIEEVFTKYEKKTEDKCTDSSHSQHKSTFWYKARNDVTKVCKGLVEVSKLL